MADPSGNRASAVFRSMGDVEAAIAAARTLGMRDVNVTTVFHPASESSRGDHISETVEYYVDLAMLGSSAEFERQLAHLSDVRSTQEHAQAAI